MSHSENYQSQFNPLMDSEETLSSVLILHNDDHNTFDYVIDCLIEICQHESNQAEQCAFITHYNGKCDIKKGELNELILMKDKLNSKGLSVSLN